MNPFVFDRPLRDGPQIGRVEELAELVKRFDDGTNTRLVSPRDYGKTSLLYRLCGHLDKVGFGAVLVDLYGVTSLEQLAHRISDAYADLPDSRITRLVSSIRRRGGTAGLVSPVGGGNLGVGGEGGSLQLLTDSLKLPEKIFEKTGNRQLVVFDEFQEVLAANLDAQIRSVIQHQGDNVTYVFSGSHPGMMRELFTDKGRPFYNQAAPLELGRFSDEAVSDFVGERFDETSKSMDSVLDRFLEITDGHPQRTMLMAHLLWDQVPMKSSADDDLLDSALEDAGAYVEDEFRAIWDRSSTLERRILEATADGLQSLRGKEATQKYGLPNGSAGETAAKRLAGSGVLLEIRPNEKRGFRIDDPFLARWIRRGRRWKAQTGD
ncbi:MAG: hypothetical protein JJE13_01675 [Thermoleophilia bacterium]|nr:hypothetical protein [Thermoleophilia bacterium]